MNPFLLLAAGALLVHVMSDATPDAPLPTATKRQLLVDYLSQQAKPPAPFVAAVQQMSDAELTDFYAFIITLKAKINPSQSTAMAQLWGRITAIISKYNLPFSN